MILILFFVTFKAFPFNLIFLSFGLTQAGCIMLFVLCFGRTLYFMVWNNGLFRRNNNMFPGFIHHKPAGLVILSQTTPRCFHPEIQNVCSKMQKCKIQNVSSEMFVINQPGLSHIVSDTSLILLTVMYFPFSEPITFWVGGCSHIMSAKLDNMAF